MLRTSRRAGLDGSSEARGRGLGHGPIMSGRAGRAVLRAPGRDRVGLGLGTCSLFGAQPGRRHLDGLAARGGLVGKAHRDDRSRGRSNRQGRTPTDARARLRPRRGQRHGGAARRGRLLRLRDGKTSSRRSSPWSPTPDRTGYWLIGADGSVYAFGDAKDEGGAGGQMRPDPVVAAAATPDGGGYWLVTSNGQVMAFGDAGSYGSIT